MGRNRINEVQTNFDDIYKYISGQPEATLNNLYTTGGIRFDCEAKITKDNRKFISLPHGNRIYENDWGYYFNDMGKDGQRIGQYSIPINKSYKEAQRTA